MPVKRLRRRYRRAMSGMGGITSQPAHSPISVFALGASASEYALTGGVVSGATQKPQKRTMSQRMFGTQPHGRRAMAGPPDWYRNQLGSLGDDTSATSQSLTAPTLVEPGPQMAQWQQAVLASQAQAMAKQDAYLAIETKQRWMQIIATLSIPVAAAIWRAIFRAGRSGE